jgi:hypothetical protein
MYGAEERYDPSRSNDKVLSQLQRFRDQELENLRMRGEREAMATRESMQNIAKIPESIADSYLQGTEENRRQRQQDMLEGQEARQKELHPLDIESRKSSLERNKFGLSEEQKQATDIQRERDWKTAKRPNSEQTNEQYAYELQQKGLEQGLAGQRAQQALTGAQQGLTGAQTTNVQQQTKTTEEDRQIRAATAEYMAAYQSGDPEAIATIDAKLKAKMDPGLMQLAKNDAGAKVKSAQEGASLFWASSDPGKKTLAQLNSIQDKASTISAIKSYIAQYNSAGFETDKANEAKNNIIALLSRPEMGPEGQNAADLVRSGVLGMRLDPAGFSKPKGRLENSLQNIEAAIGADLQQIEVQNKGIKVPIFLNTYQNTVDSYEKAKNTPTKEAAPNLFSNPTPTNPGGATQQVNTAPPALEPNPPNKQQLLNARPAKAPVTPTSRFRRIQDRGQ